MLAVKNFFVSFAALDVPTLSPVCAATYFSISFVTAWTDVPVDLIPFLLINASASVVLTVSKLKSSNKPYALSVAGTRFDSIVFSDVPASEPFNPLFANRPSAVFASLNDIPTPSATEPTAANE
ncbi:hypothetical protein D1872_214780 [compost metagenome]